MQRSSRARSSGSGRPQRRAAAVAASRKRTRDASSDSEGSSNDDDAPRASQPRKRRTTAPSTAKPAVTTTTVPATKPAATSAATTKPPASRPNAPQDDDDAAIEAAVRDPIAPVRGVLLEGDGRAHPFASSRASSRVRETYLQSLRDFKADEARFRTCTCLKPQLCCLLMSPCRLAEGTSVARSRKVDLAELFAPPIDIMYPGTFEQVCGNVKLACTVECQAVTDTSDSCCKTECPINVGSLSTFRSVTNSRRSS